MAKNRIVNTGIYATEIVADPAQDGPHKHATPFEIGAILDRAKREAEQAIEAHDANEPIAKDAAKLMRYVTSVRSAVRFLSKIPNYERFFKDHFASAFHAGLLCERLLVRRHEPAVSTGYRVRAPLDATRARKSQRDERIRVAYQKLLASDEFTNKFINKKVVRQRIAKQFHLGDSRVREIVTRKK